MSKNYLDLSKNYLDLSKNYFKKIKTILGLSILKLFRIGNSELMTLFDRLTGGLMEVEIDCKDKKCIEEVKCTDKQKPESLFSSLIGEDYSAEFSIFQNTSSPSFQKKKYVERDYKQLSQSLFSSLVGDDYIANVSSYDKMSISLHTTSDSGMQVVAKNNVELIGVPMKKTKHKRDDESDADEEGGIGSGKGKKGEGSGGGMHGREVEGVGRAREVGIMGEGGWTEEMEEEGEEEEAVEVREVDVEEVVEEGDGEAFDSIDADTVRDCIEHVRDTVFSQVLAGADI
jgi:hypothetical protein